ncbi:MAG TPA: nuclear transport factor 2 family protein [Chitinophagaceae bacterium]|nr:nuclear transport factor 2 family protein [Chitinophagaceae bacterium]
MARPKSKKNDAGPKTPKKTIEKWVEAFNSRDVPALGELYHPKAVNHQVVNRPVRGRKAILSMFQREFAQFEMVCIVENIFEDGEWGMLEWKDPSGLRGCGFFRVQNGKILFQRGYWDRMSFLEAQKLPIKA